MTILRLCRKRNAAVFMQYQFGSSREKKNVKWVSPFSLSAFDEAAGIAGYSASFYLSEDHLLNNTRAIPGSAPESFLGFVFLQPV